MTFMYKQNLKQYKWLNWITKDICYLNLTNLKILSIKNNTNNKYLKKIITSTLEVELSRCSLQLKLCFIQNNYFISFSLNQVFQSLKWKNIWNWYFVCSLWKQFWEKTKVSWIHKCNFKNFMIIFQKFSHETVKIILHIKSSIYVFRNLFELTIYS